MPGNPFDWKERQRKSGGQKDRYAKPHLERNWRCLWAIAGLQSFGRWNPSSTCWLHRTYTSLHWWTVAVHFWQWSLSFLFVLELPGSTSGRGRPFRLLRTYIRGAKIASWPRCRWCTVLLRIEFSCLLHNNSCLRFWAIRHHRASVEQGVQWGSAHWSGKATYGGASSFLHPGNEVRTKLFVAVR